MLLNLAIVIVAVTIVLYIIKTWLNQIEEKSKISDELVEWLKSSTASVDEKLSKNLEVFANLQRTIGEFSQIGRSMAELQEFLTSPKIRGSIGEQILKDLLAQNFPKGTYQTQYGFKNGVRVDAVIKTSQGIIPIDSKFPIDNFKKMVRAATPQDKEACKREFIRDVKKHIEDIARKYIQVDENTLDYALMYIPSEAVYYEIINDGDLFDYAGKNRILPVSPMSFYAYMKAILMSFEGQKIQTKAKEILEILKAIKKDYERSEEALNILSKHITNAYNQTAQVTKSIASLGQKISSTTLLSPDEKKMIE